MRASAAEGVSAVLPSMPATAPRITESSVANLLAGDPQTIVTACPLCLKTFSESVPESVQVKDFAETLV